MTITNLFPANNAAGVCADTKLWITFATTPIVATDSNMHLQICKADNSVVYQLTLHTLPGDAYGHNQASPGWPYQITIGGLGFVNYEPFAVSNQTLEIYPSTRLAYNTTYYVKMTDGFCHDASGNTSPAMTDNTTWQFTTKAAPTVGHNYTIALDGSGDFCTLQGACDYVTDNDATRTFIKIKKGTYRELINIPSSKINITWLGEDKDTAIIAAYNRDAFNGGTSTRNLVRNSGNGLRMYNLTLQNTTPKGGQQAETIRQNATKCIAKNCKFKSYQDTLYLSGGQTYLNNCYVEGDTDYIWGGGTAYFDKCEIRSMSTSSYVTQPRTYTTNGLFLVDCNMTMAAEVTASSCYMARLFNANDYTQSVYINCTMPKTLFSSIGWYKNNQVNMDNLRLWEYKSVEPNGTLIDVSGRLNPGSRQLTDANAVWWRDVNHVFSAVSPWNPKNLGELPTASWQPQPADGTTDITIAHMTLTWAAGAEAESHVVYFGTDNPPTSGTEQTGTSFVTETLSPGITYYWRVDEKNSTGTTTGTVWSFTTSTALDANSPSPDPMTWAHEPNAVSSSSITMMASKATDISGVEYYFTCTAGGGHNSGWQDSNTYTDTGLTNNTTYTYKVKARDKSINQNETVDSNEKSAKTPIYDCTTLPTLLSDLNGNCQVDSLDFVRLADAWAGNPPEVDLNGDEVLDFKDIAQFAEDWLKCNRSPADQCWQ
jgi:hypothetical protein